MSFPERILGWAGSEGPDAARAKLAALGTLLMIHASLEVGLWAYQSGSVSIGFSALGLALAFVLSRLPGRSRMGTACAAVLMLAVHVQLFPGSSNHLMLVFLGLAVLALFDLSQDAEAEAALATLRWLTVIVLFWTGMQKVLYGTYFQAEFLAWSIAHEARFSGVLQYAVSAEELGRLQRLAAGAADAGVYRTKELALLLASNGSYLAELTLPCLLLLRRTRAWAVIATVAFLALIEAGAREVLFGVLFVNLVLLFSSRNALGRLLPLSVALYAAAVASQLGVLPDMGLN